MPKSMLALLLFCLLLSSCAPRPAELTVLAAASLAEPFTELGRLFEQRHPGVTVNFNFAGSQQLARQLAGGALADVFASADNRQMEDLIATNRADGVHPLTTNRLVVIVPWDNPGQVRGLEELARPGLKLVLGAEQVPVGAYTREFLEKATTAYGADYPQKVRANVVSYEENVKSVLTKVTLGEADAGLVYISDVAGSAGEKVLQVAIPAGLNIRAEYPITVLRDSTQLSLARQFVELALSAEGQAVMKRYRFGSE